MTPAAQAAVVHANHAPGSLTIEEVVAIRDALIAAEFRVAELEEFIRRVSNGEVRKA